MNQILEMLAIAVPEKDHECMSLCDHKPKALEAWLDTLPIANTHEASRLMCQATQEIGRLNITTSLRFELLELIRSKVHFINDLVAPQYEKNPIILTSETKKNLNISQSLNKYLALGYKICFVDALADGGRLFKSQKKYIAISIHRHMVELVFIVLRCYKLYIFNTPNLWIDLHSTYLLAQELGLLENRFKDDFIDNKNKYSISDIYKKALILSTSQPNQLQSKDLNNLFYSSNRWGHLVKINDSVTNSAIDYVLELNTDEAPKKSKNILDKDYYRRYVSMALLVKHFKENSELKLSNEPDAFIWETSYVSSLLANHLLSTWISPSKKRKDRQHIDNPVIAILGFQECYESLKFINMNTAEVEESVQPESTSTSTEINIEDGYGFRNIKKNIIEDGAIKLHNCQMLNADANGTCLIWQSKPPKSLSNGNLILLKTDQEYSWHFGVIRWTQHIKREGIRTGVKFFAKNSVTTSVKMNHGPKEQWIPAILIPPVFLGSPPSLIAPPQKTLRGMGVMMYSGTQVVKFDIQEEQTSFFQKVQVKTVD